MNILPKHIKAVQLSNLGVHLEPSSSFSGDQVFEEHAPEVKSWEAEQDKGSNSVIVRGVPEAYFVQAMEFDDVGLFDTADEAIGEAECNHGEFFL